MNLNSLTISENLDFQQARKIFTSACEWLAPVVAANDKIKTISSYAMRLMLMYRYPDLNSEKIHIVIIVVEKLHWE